eukprot:g561.t1
MLISSYYAYRLRNVRFRLQNILIEADKFDEEQEENRLLKLKMRGKGNILGGGHHNNNSNNNNNNGIGLNGISVGGLVDGLGDVSLLDHSHDMDEESNIFANYLDSPYSDPSRLTWYAQIRGVLYSLRLMSSLMMFCILVLGVNGCYSLFVGSYEIWELTSVHPASNSTATTVTSMTSAKWGLRDDTAGETSPATPVVILNLIYPGGKWSADHLVMLTLLVYGICELIPSLYLVLNLFIAPTPEPNIMVPPDNVHDIGGPQSMDHHGYHGTGSIFDDIAFIGLDHGNNAFSKGHNNHFQDNNRSFGLDSVLLSSTNFLYGRRPSGSVATAASGGNFGTFYNNGTTGMQTSTNNSFRQKMNDTIFQAPDNGHHLMSYQTSNFYIQTHQQDNTVLDFHNVGASQIDQFLRTSPPRQGGAGHLPESPKRQILTNVVQETTSGRKGGGKNGVPTRNKTVNYGDNNNSALNKKDSNASMGTNTRIMGTNTRIGDTNTSSTSENFIETPYQKTPFNHRRLSLEQMNAFYESGGAGEGRPINNSDAGTVKTELFYDRDNY